LVLRRSRGWAARSGAAGQPMPDPACRSPPRNRRTSGSDDVRTTLLPQAQGRRVPAHCRTDTSLDRGGGVIGDELGGHNGARPAQPGRVVEKHKTLALARIAERAGRPRTSVVASGQGPSWPASVDHAEKLSYRCLCRVPARLGPVTDSPSTHREGGVCLLGVWESRRACRRRRCTRVRRARGRRGGRGWL
jgi:hypothetical protein